MKNKPGVEMIKCGMACRTTGAVLEQGPVKRKQNLETKQKLKN